MRLGRFVAVLALLSLTSVSTASAQGWGREWFEKLSGPGPFSGVGLQFPVGCRWQTPGDKKFYWSFQTPEGMALQRGDRPRPGDLGDENSARLLCIDFQYTSAANDDSGTIGLIDLHETEGRVGFPLERKGFPWWTAAFEPSVSAGAIHFQGGGFDEWRFTFSPEITFKPLKLIPARAVKLARPNKRGDWRGVVEIAYGAVFITPKVTNEDLRVPFLNPFEHGWLERGAWIRVNVSELVGLR